MRLLQITEDDLAELERSLPMLVDALYPTMDNRTRAMVRRVRQVVTNVRWNYGPPTDVEVVPVPPDQADS